MADKILHDSVDAHYDLATFTSGASIGYQLKHTYALMHECASEAYADTDLSFVQCLVLLKIKEGAATTARDLCRLLLHDTGALTRMLDQLESRGYLHRQRSKADRRVIELQLTAQGHDKLAELTPILVDKLNAALADFSRAELAELTRLLNKLVSTIQASRELTSPGLETSPETSKRSTGGTA